MNNKKNNMLDMEKLVNDFFNEPKEKYLIKIFENGQKTLENSEKILNYIDEMNDRIYDLEELLQD